MIVAVNVIGNHVPLMLIYPRSHFKNHIPSGAPTASIESANPTVWSHEKVFVDYMKHI